jgi:hypothetical protein
MKSKLFTIIAIAFSLCTIWNARAESGPPTLQEVEAAGEGATEDEAFKQAVVEAVRQVVGTLVSAENVVNNDKVIKDEVLTLSNGFVEKVLNQDKSKQGDGSWLVKLKCVVRKGQLYGKLNEVKVPTIKFEGVSIFADVLSQNSMEKDSAALLANAILGWNGNMYEAVSLSPKPEIIEKNENRVTIRMSCRVALRRSIYESQFVAKLTNVLENISNGSVNRGLTQNEKVNYYLKDEKVIFIDGVSKGYAIKTETFATICKKVGLDEGNSCFGDNSWTQLQLFAVFRDSENQCLVITQREGGPYLETATAPSTLNRYNISPQLRNISGEPSDTKEFLFDATIPLRLLSKITKIELHVAEAFAPDFCEDNLPAEAPGGFLYRCYETGWLWKYAKSSEDRKEVRHCGGSHYLPTLQLTGPSQEFWSQTK